MQIAFERVGVKVKDYRVLIRERVEVLKKSEQKVNFSLLAKAVKVSPHYLSRVMKRNGHLSEDQVFRAVRFLGIAGPQEDYLFALHRYAKSACSIRRKMLFEDVERLRREVDSTKSYLEVIKLEKEDEKLSVFFTKPQAQLIYASLFIEKIQADTYKLCTFLNIAKKSLDDSLDFLEQIGLIARTATRVFPISKKLHLAENHPFFEAYQKLVRLEFQKFETSTIKFSVFTSVSVDDAQRINLVLLRALKEVEAIASKTCPETLLGIELSLVDCFQQS